MKRPKFKFRIGQVVFNECEQAYCRITAKDREFGPNSYTLAFQGDEDYDYVDENDLRPLTRREFGK